jgi:8-oxo-dGTP pyrophosphatase MutT (NUDIX family)
MYRKRRYSETAQRELGRRSRTMPQAGVLAVHGERICLVTSRGGNGLVAPKGCLEPGRTAKQMALQEAWEEAGLIGVLRPGPIGCYRYEKAGKRLTVVMFLMDVIALAKTWPERHKRSRHWLLPTEAAIRVRERGLRMLLLKLATTDSIRRPARRRKAG